MTTVERQEAETARLCAEVRIIQETLDRELKSAIKLSRYCLGLAEESLRHAQDMARANEALLAETRRTTKPKRAGLFRRMFR